MAVHWGVLGVINPPSETRHYTYLLRLGAFLMIVIGIVEKNRASR
jgi:hypothetical protein